MDRSRLEAFSDGVFAVAITLLVLNLAVAGPGTPGHLNPPLLHQLGRLWPSFAAYVVSFFMIGIIWVNHHVLIRSFKEVDRTLLFLNLILVMFVVLIPFATATVADYRLSNSRDGRVHRAQDKDAGNAQALERLSQDPRFERAQIGGDVGQFRHCTQIASFPPYVARTFCGKVK